MGESEQRLCALPAWRETPFYTERELAALAWTEAITLISQGHAPDEVFEQARTQFTEEELVNLTMAIIAISGWNRFTYGTAVAKSPLSEEHLDLQKSEDTMTKSKIRALLVGVVVCVMVGATFAQSSPPPHPSESADRAINVRFEDLTWDRMVPELAERSPEIAILRVDPKTKATHLLIRVPADMHIPKHWHTASETHTVVKGTFIMECEGKRQTLGQGSWNYIPSKMAHEAWTTPEEETVLFITLDSAWDQHWVGAAPKPTDFLGGRKE